MTYAAIAHEALYDDNCAQVESLLSIHQSLVNPKNVIDDRARCECVNVISMGGQDDKRPGSATQKYHFFLMDQNVFLSYV